MKDAAGQSCCVLLASLRGSR